MRKKVNAVVRIDRALKLQHNDLCRLQRDASREGVTCSVRLARYMLGLSHGLTLEETVPSDNKTSSR